MKPWGLEKEKSAALWGYQGTASSSPKVLELLLWVRGQGPWESQARFPRASKSWEKEQKGKHSTLSFLPWLLPAYSSSSRKNKQSVWASSNVLCNKRFLLFACNQKANNKCDFMCVFELWTLFVSFSEKNTFDLFYFTVTEFGVICQRSATSAFFGTVLQNV